jgi:hypothetical protein
MIAMSAVIKVKIHTEDSRARLAQKSTLSIGRIFDIDLMHKSIIIIGKLKTA